MPNKVEVVSVYIGKYKILAYIVQVPIRSIQYRHIKLSYRVVLKSEETFDITFAALQFKAFQMNFFCKGMC